MGNACVCVSRQSDDDAEDALLASFEEEGRPRGPPPPYQVGHYPIGIEEGMGVFYKTKCLFWGNLLAFMKKECM